MPVPSFAEAGGASFGTNPGRQGSTHLSFVADPIQNNIIYLGGDRQFIRIFIEFLRNLRFILKATCLQRKCSHSRRLQSISQCIGSDWLFWYDYFANISQRNGKLTNFCEGRLFRGDRLTNTWVSLTHSGTVRFVRSRIYISHFS
jgi:hypothetical protein